MKTRELLARVEIIKVKIADLEKQEKQINNKIDKLLQDLNNDFTKKEITADIKHMININNIKRG